MAPNLLAATQPDRHYSQVTASATTSACCTPTIEGRPVGAVYVELGALSLEQQKTFELLADLALRLQPVLKPPLPEKDEGPCCESGAPRCGLACDIRVHANQAANANRILAGLLAHLDV